MGAKVLYLSAIEVQAEDLEDAKKNAAPQQSKRPSIPVSSEQGKAALQRIK